ncbi:Protein of uncharacterised function (DUF1573) [Candidatus Ornithobacterium hominis]|uniref:DUF1573 domain-containing protein n=1 Tax=Candidatus Ornithobacterium hominis TaxID=2497989 RepID=UPI000E5C1D2B|nr:DUF1573 domain-containing protein [Candidatus Ornithobacterium hominis]SZD73658.1 Protein of uncharacterised function (DUF1573) [Candidatus Ornithobacterium hominis]
MKKVILLAIIGGMLNLACEKKQEQTTQAALPTQAEPQAVDPANAPVFTLEQENYDFGDVKANEKVTKIITFINTGASPLQIKDAKASCGCTVPKYSDKPIAPGEKGELTVEYTAPAMNGKQMKTVILITNTANQQEEFKISANVVEGQDAPASPAPNTNVAPPPTFN